MNLIKLKSDIKKHGQARLAAELGVTAQAMWNWLNRQKQVPAIYVLAIEKETGIHCWNIRPDLYPRSRFKAASSDTVKQVVDSAR